MADLFFADLVREACWATGAGDLALGGALPGHRSFADTVPAGARFHYCIAGVTRPDEWETGVGELGSGGALIRVPLASSAGGAAVDFGPGLKTVALTVAAAWFAARDGGLASIGDIAGLQEALDGKAPDGHGHETGEIEGLEAALDAKAAAAHGHAPGDVAGLEAALDGKAPDGHGHETGEIEGLEAALDAKAAAAHGHAPGDVAGLEAALDGKAAAVHGHALGEVAGLEAALDAKAAAVHGHDFASLSGKPTTLAGYGIGDAQLHDPELDALAALGTTAFGRSLLELGDAAALRTAAETDLHYLRPRNLGVSLMARYQNSGRYYPATGCTFGAASGIAVTSTSLLYAQAFEIRIALTHISFEVTVAGGAGGKVRIGLYDCLENGLPGDLLHDLGETAVDVAGVQQVALPETFAVDRPVWFAFVSNDLAWQTRWFDILASENQRSFGVSALSGGGTVAGLRGIHSFGPLPASFPAIASTYSQCRTFAGRATG